MLENYYSNIIKSHLDKKLNITNINLETNIIADLRLSSSDLVTLLLSLREEKIKLRPIDLYENPTLRDIATLLCNSENCETLSSKGKVAQILDGSLPFVPSELFYKEECGWSKFYDIHFLLGFEYGKYDISKIISTVSEVVTTHPDLMTTIKKFDSSLPEYDLYKPNLSQVLKICDCRGKTQLEVETIVKKESALARGNLTFGKENPLHRTVLFKNTPDWELMFYFVVHHYIMDGYGSRMFAKILKDTYSGSKTWLPKSGNSSIETNSQVEWSKQYNKYIKCEVRNEAELWEKYLQSKNVVPLQSYEHEFNRSEYSHTPTFSKESHDDLVKLRMDQPSDVRMYKASFHNQATVISFLNQHHTRQLLVNLDSVDKGVIGDITSIDVIMLALTRCIMENNQGEGLLIDNYTTGRAGVFDDLNLVDRLGVHNSISTIKLEYSNCTMTMEGLSSVAKARKFMPRNGVGYRALKYIDHYSDSRNRKDEVANNVIKPESEIGLNYVAGLDNLFSENDFGVKLKNYDTGVDLSYSGMPYKYYVRLYKIGQCMGIDIMYDDKLFTVERMMKLSDRFRNEIAEIAVFVIEDSLK